MKYVLQICADERGAPSNADVAADPVHQGWEADLARRVAEIRPVGE